MNAEQKQRAAELLSAWRATAYALHADRMADLLQELVDAPEAEPFGYFKAEPFGWTDCAETDDGAIALFDAPPAPTPAEAPADVARDVRLQVEAEFAALLPGVTYMDEPDGGSPTVQEQVKRMAKDAERYRLLRKRYWSGNLLDAEVDAAIEREILGGEA